MDMFIWCSLSRAVTPLKLGPKIARIPNGKKMYFPNFMLKNSQLHLHFDLKRLCQESSLKQLKNFKRGRTLNYQDHWKSKRKHWFYSSFKRCAIFPNFSKILIIFPIQRGHDPIPRRDVTTLLRGYFRWYYTYVLSRSFLSNDWLTSQRTI